ncbi:beta strand repeat-containing protein, partial [Tsuneonella rigui]|uniref:beta strand repeat-containing protein n=1 Tax=Tsuneonella rigui TaxID=1708790 RepID=UPI003B96DEF6
MLTDRRRTALTYCSALAIATALAAVPQAAQAQSFQGTSTVVAGNAAVTTGANSTTVTVNSAQAVINWTPTDTTTNPGVPILFQPGGTTATFQSTGQFAVLNRIVPVDASRPITFNGTVISQIQGTTTTPGGTVYFYSPGGVIVGANAVFNVGNLGLTTSDPLISGGNFIDANGKVTFTGAAPASYVEIRPGAQINALNTGSYVAAFAPGVYQYGTVTTNGQAAYVAGEAGTITFAPDGLFDIQVTTGTDAINGGPNAVAIEHTGTTTGGASAGAGDNRRIYMVAVPKNQLITLAIGRGSSLGFDVAGAANVDGNAVVLSAGYNVTAGAIENAPAGGTGRADLTISDYNGPSQPSGMTVTSALTGKASRNARLNVLANSNFASDVSLTAIEDSAAVVTIATSPTAGVLTTGNLNVVGNLTLSAERQVAVPGSPVDAGAARMIVFGGATADISGDLSLLANGWWYSTADGATTGGEASLLVDSDPAITSATSSLDVGGNLLLRAQGITDFAPTVMDATGGNALIRFDHGSGASVAGVTRIRSEGVTNGGNATGGTSQLDVMQGSSFTTGELNVSADGSTDFGSLTATPGLSTGGLANITASDSSTLTVQAGNSTGNLIFGDLELLSAEAFGGASNAGGGHGGAAKGGQATLNVLSGSTVNLPVDPGAAGSVTMFARATGGDTFATGGTGGDATGGIASVNVDGGTLNGGNRFTVSSFALGGSADVSVTGAADGGDAFGGQRNVLVRNGTVNGSFSGGGPGAQGGDGSLTGTGGDGTGGTSSFILDQGTINAVTDSFGPGRVLAFTQNGGGKGRVGGNTSGGVLNVSLTSSTINASGAGSSITWGSFNSTPDAIATGVVSTGNATAGTANISLVDSSISAETVDIYANATTGSITTSGGAGTGAHTGNATAGTTVLNLVDSTIAGGSVTIEASARAGGSNDSAAVNGGIATGGEASVFVHDGASTITASGGLIVAAAAGGGTISNAGTGGDAAGGYARIHAFNGGTLTVNADTMFDAGARGQTSLQGHGGDAVSGFAQASTNGGSLTFNGNLDVTANAFGGNGQPGGAASAAFETDRPNALMFAQNGAISVSGLTTILSESYSGGGLLGGAGGDAAGGFAVVDAQSNLGGASTISLQDLLVSTDGFGGVGATGLSGAAGGAGGAGFGGESEALADAGNGKLTIAGQTTLSSQGVGGDGG